MLLHNHKTEGYYALCICTHYGLQMGISSKIPKYTWLFSLVGMVVTALRRRQLGVQVAGYGRQVPSPFLV
jgi:predicted alpha/beta hydrolase